MSDVSRVGQFGVVRTHTPMGWLIRLATRSQVSHAYLVVSEAGHVIEATWGGAVLSASPKWETEAPGELHPTSRLDLTASQQAAVVEEAHRLLGTPYGFLDIAALGLVSLGVRWKWACRVARRERGLICSQLVDRVYANVGIHLYADGRPDGSVTPGDLLLLLAERSALTVLPPPITESEEAPEG